MALVSSRVCTTCGEPDSRPGTMRRSGRGRTRSGPRSPSSGGAVNIPNDSSGGEGIRTPGSVAATAVFKNGDDPLQITGHRENKPSGDPRGREIAPVDPPAAHSWPIEATDTELERAIVDAVAAGAFDVARVLAARLEDRMRKGVTNVVPIRR